MWRRMDVEKKERKEDGKEKRSHAPLNPPLCALSPFLLGRMKCHTTHEPIAFFFCCWLRPSALRVVRPLIHPFLLISIPPFSIEDAAAVLLAAHPALLHPYYLHCHPRWHITCPPQLDPHLRQTRHTGQLSVSTFALSAFLRWYHQGRSQRQPRLCKDIELSQSPQDLVCPFLRPGATLDDISFSRSPLVHIYGEIGPLERQLLSVL